MKFKEKLLLIRDRTSHHPITLWLTKHRRLLFVLLGLILLTILALTLFFGKKPIEIPPYVATYRVETQTTFGNIHNEQTEKVVVSHLDNLYKSERFVNDIALLESSYNTPEGFIFCSYKQDFDCQRLGNALTKNIGSPPKIKELKKSSSVAKKVNISNQDRPCHETTYSLPSSSDKNGLIQNLSATVCLDDALSIPLSASFEARYRVNDITEYQDYQIKQTRILTDLNTTPNLTASDFTPPTPQ